jgi:putative ABC transport system permease protein
VRALGATPGQATAGLSAAQVLPALAGALLGIPAGTALYAAVQHGGAAGRPPAAWLLAMVGGMLAAAAGLTVAPARAGARQPVAVALRSGAL